MNIVTKLTDSLVKLRGCVDSSNAHQFEEELLAAISGQTLTLDAEELAYISSAGLRVLLKAKKTLGGELIVQAIEDIAAGTVQSRPNKVDEGRYFTWPTTEQAKEFLAKGCRLI